MSVARPVKLILLYLFCCGPAPLVCVAAQPALSGALYSTLEKSQNVTSRLLLERGSVKLFGAFMYRGTEAEWAVAGVDTAWSVTGPLRLTGLLREIDAPFGFSPGSSVGVERADVLLRTDAVRPARVGGRIGRSASRLALFGWADQSGAPHAGWLLRDRKGPHSGVMRATVCAAGAISAPRPAQGEGWFEDVPGWPGGLLSHGALSLLACTPAMHASLLLAGTLSQRTPPGALVRFSGCLSDQLGRMFAARAVWAPGAYRGFGATACERVLRIDLKLRRTAEESQPEEQRSRPGWSLAFRHTRYHKSTRQWNFPVPVENVAGAEITLVRNEREGVLRRIPVGMRWVGTSSGGEHAHAYRVNGGLETERTHITHRLSLTGERRESGSYAWNVRLAASWRTERVEVSAEVERFRGTSGRTEAFVRISDRDLRWYAGISTNGRIEDVRFWHPDASTRVNRPFLVVNAGFRLTVPE